MTKKKGNKSKVKKESGSFTGIVLFLLLPALAIVFISLILRTEIKFLYKDIDKNEKHLEVLQNMLELKLVNVQKLTAENRIVPYAKEHLGMVRINSAVKNIYVDEFKVKQIKRIVESKYE